MRRQLTNIGKTVALGIDVGVGIVIISESDQLNFNYTRGYTWGVKVGSLAPNLPQLVDDALFDSKNETVMVLTPPMEKDRRDGRLHIFVYGKIRCKDIFAGEVVHKVRICAFVQCLGQRIDLTPITKRWVEKCSAYNGIDSTIE
jgi:hypothetical protein